MNKLNNIIAIDRIKAGSINGLRRLGIASVCVSPDIPWESIPIKIPAKLTISDKIDNGIRLYTAQLVYRTCEKSSDMEKIVYRCKTAAGLYYLIGNNDRPYPISTSVENHPDNMKDSQLYEVTVNYTSPVEIPYII